ncbi:hypothetical protein WA158_001911 [Blastocystis sp. Blastoise]
MNTEIDKTESNTNVVVDPVETTKSSQETEIPTVALEEKVDELKTDATKQDSKEEERKSTETDVEPNQPQNEPTKPEVSSGWGWSSFLTSIKKTTTELAEKAQKVAETSAVSAKKVYDQLKEKSEAMMEEIKVEEEKAQTMSQLQDQVTYPWDGIEYTSVKEDLKKEILELSTNENTFTIGNKEHSGSFNMNENIPLILKMRKIDPNISKYRLKLVQSKLLKDEVFWGNYFSNVKKVQLKYLEIIKQNKLRPATPIVNTTNNNNTTNNSNNDINNNNNSNNSNSTPITDSTVNIASSTNVASSSVTETPQSTLSYDIDDIDKQLSEFDGIDLDLGDADANEEDIDIDVLEASLRNELGM